jgi:uncharacterized protein
MAAAVPLSLGAFLAPQAASAAPASPVSIEFIFYNPPGRDTGSNASLNAEYVILQNGMLDIDDSVREALILTFPMRLLCDEDCLGLCPKCGKPRREGECGCTTKEVDPRWAVLASLKFDEEDGGEKQ